jgi:hypothetical protein
MTLFTNWYFIVTQSLYQTHDTNKHKKKNQFFFLVVFFLKKIEKRKKPNYYFYSFKNQKKGKQNNKKETKIREFLLEFKERERKEKNLLLLEFNNRKN